MIKKILSVGTPRRDGKNAKAAGACIAVDGNAMSANRGTVPGLLLDLPSSPNWGKGENHLRRLEAWARNMPFPLARSAGRGLARTADICVKGALAITAGRMNPQSTLIPASLTTLACFAISERRCALN